MSDSAIRLTLTLNGKPGTAAEDLEEMARRLRDDLLELNVETLEPSEKEAPDGSKAGLAIDWTTLLVTVASSNALAAIIAAIQSWLLRNRENNVTLRIGDDELIITGVGPYSKKQDLAIEQWLRRHKGYILPNE